MDNLKVLPLMPLRELVVFPQTAVPLFIGRTKSIIAVEKAYQRDKLIFLAAQKDPKIDAPTPEDIYRVGTICRILQLVRLPDNTLKVLVEGLARGRIVRYLTTEEYFSVEVEEMNEVLEEDAEIIALMNLCKEALEEYAQYNKKLNQDTVSTLLTLDNPLEFVDRLSALLNLKVEVKQKLLETISVKKRLETVLGHLRGEIEIIKTEARIRERVKKQMEKHQRDYYLQEQMKAIQKELGEREDGRSDLAELEKRIKKKKLPKEAKEVVWKEFKKLSLMPPMSAEATVVRNYIDWILSLPWYEKTKENIDLDKVEELLNKEHYGLEKPKQRIIEHLAVQKACPKIKGPILCFVGPPGLVRLLLARSIGKLSAETL
jgi:ATP-dependent proteinase. Serine peptidase. MEROPS family S16